MLNKKTNIVQLVIFAFMILTIQIVLSAFYLLDYNTDLRDNFSLSATENAENMSYAAGQTLDNIIFEGKNLKLSSLTSTTAIPEGFDGIGFIAAIKDGLSELYNFNLKIEGEGLYNGKIPATTKDSLQNDKVIKFTFAELTGTAPKEGGYSGYYEIYGCPNEDKTMTLLLSKYGRLTGEINKYNFDSIYIYKYNDALKETGAILSGADDGKALESKLTAFKNNVNITGKAFAFIDDSFMTVQKIEGTNLCIVCVVEKLSLQNALQRLLSNMIMILAVYIFFSILTMVLGILFYTKKYNNLLFYNGKHKSNFVLSVDRYGNVKRANETFKQYFKVKNVFDEVFSAGAATAEKLGRGEPIIVQIKDKNEVQRYLTLLCSPTFSGYKFVGGDTSDFVNLYITAHERNFTDTVTGLQNEEILIKDFENDLKIRKDYKTMMGFLDAINLSEFQVMSGRYFADQILRALGEKLNLLFKDFGRVYYDGEHFAILTNNEVNTELQEKLVDIMQKLNTPMSVGNNLILLKVKAGFIILDKHTEDWAYEAIKTNVMSALKRAQKTHDTLYFVFHQLQSKHYLGYKTFDIPVSELIANDAIDVFFQPQLDLKTRIIGGFEALCRLKGGFMQDMNIQQFIEMVERRGEMIELGDFIYDKSLSFAKEIEQYGATVSLNVSPIQMLQSGFADKILKKFNNHNLKSDSVCIEVTETFLMTSFDDIVPKLEELKRKGIDVHLDDFGVEHSSYLYLKKLPISVIKIDREFVKDLETDKYSKVIIESMVNIAKKLNLGCIAEGVENENQLKWLKEIGCQAVQGFFVSQAISRDRALKMLIDSINNQVKSEEPNARK